jgi:ATP-dependent Clp protease ATP-binding subunit ClpC
MTPRFTAKARKSIILARDTAEQFGHDFLGPEHLLLGIIQAGEGNFSRFLESVGLSAVNIKKEVQNKVSPGDQTSLEIPFNNEARRAIEYAVEICRFQTHEYVGSEHLFLGLLRIKTGVPREVFSYHNIKYDEALEAILRLLAEHGEDKVFE